MAEFLCQNKDKECIAEALSTIKGWNPTWDPKYFMVDYSIAEINAIEASFRKLPFTFVFIENKRGKDGPKLGKNGLTLGEQVMFLEFMQQIARPRNIQSYQKSVESLRKSTLYAGNPQVEDYCEKVWLSCSKRWCHAFCVQQAVNIMNTNKGIEAQNKVFKYSYLWSSLGKSVFGIAVMIAESFVPDSYQHYLDTNLQVSSSYRQYNRNLPNYLHNRLIHFVKHCLKANFVASEFKECDVTCVSFEKGKFLVRSSCNSNWLYAVKFSEPRCQCQSWHKTHFPCKHFSAVFKFFEEWGFNSLLDSCRNSVFITLDLTNLSDSNPVQKPPLQPFTSDDSRNGCGGDDYDPLDNTATPDITEATIPSLEDGEKDGSNS